MKNGGIAPCFFLKKTKGETDNGNALWSEAIVSARFGGAQGLFAAASRLFSSSS